MKLEICENHLKIVPEGAQDIAYIKDTLGLKENGDSIKLVRRNIQFNHCGFNLYTEKED